MKHFISNVCVVSCMEKGKLAQRISELSIALCCSPDMLTQSLEREASRRWMHVKLDRELHVIAESIRLLTTQKRKDVLAAALEKAMGHDSR